MRYISSGDPIVSVVLSVLKANRDKLPLPVPGCGYCTSGNGSEEDWLLRAAAHGVVARCREFVEVGVIETVAREAIDAETFDGMFDALTEATVLDYFMNDSVHFGSSWGVEK